MMMSLGDFVFELSTLAYQSLQRSTAWRHPSSDPVGSAPKYQSIGKGADTFNMSGSIVPEFGNRESLDTVRNMADAGSAYALVDGTGRVYGMYVITQVTENASYFLKDGTPLKTEFSIALTRAGDVHDSTQTAQQKEFNKIGKVDS